MEQIATYYNIVKDDDKLLVFPRRLICKPSVGDWIETFDGMQIRKVTQVTICKESLIIELDNPFWRPKEKQS